MTPTQLVALLQPLIGQATVNVAVETRFNSPVTVNDVKGGRPIAKVTTLSGGAVAVAVDNMHVTILDAKYVTGIVIRPREEVDPPGGHYG